MITTVTAKVLDIQTGAVDRSLVLTMNDPKFLVKDISGLGPVKADASFADKASGPGGIYLASHAQKRNIVMTIGFNPQYSINETISDLREDLYGLYLPGEVVDLEIVDDVKGTYKITGVVESHEPNLFSDDPQVVISILCEYPYFKKSESATVFTCPDTQDFTLDFDGLIPVGFVFNCVCDYDNGIDNWQLDQYPYRPLYIGVDGFNTAVGDEFEISTVEGDRYATYRRSSSTNHMEGYLKGSLATMKLYPGNNYFSFFYRNTMEAATMTITYQKVYGGL